MPFQSSGNVLSEMKSAIKSCRKVMKYKINQLELKRKRTIMLPAQVWNNEEIGINAGSKISRILPWKIVVIDFLIRVNN